MKPLVLSLLVACSIPQPTRFDGHSIIGRWHRDGSDIVYTFWPYTHTYGRVDIDGDRDGRIVAKWQTRYRKKRDELLFFDYVHAGTGFHLADTPTWVPFHFIDSRTLVIGSRTYRRV